MNKYEIEYFDQDSKKTFYIETRAHTAEDAWFIANINAERDVSIQGEGEPVLIPVAIKAIE